MTAAPSVARPKERSLRGNFLNAYYDLRAAPRNSTANVSKFCRHVNNSPEYDILWATNYLWISASLLSLFSPLGCHRAWDNEGQARDTLSQFAAIEDVYVSQCLISLNLPDPSSIYAWQTSSDGPTMWTFSGLVANLLLVVTWVSVSHADFGISQILAPRLCNPLSARIRSLERRFTKVCCFQNILRLYSGLRPFSRHLNQYTSPQHE